jgi:hypothetical protein
MYVDICCSADSMTCGSALKISLNSVNKFVSLFSRSHSRPSKENSCQRRDRNRPSLSLYVASDFAVA